MSAQPLLPTAEAKALADKLIKLLTTTNIAKGGCTVCGRPGHVAGHHDEPDNQGSVDAAPNPSEVDRG